MIPDKIPKQEYTDLNGKVLFPFSFDVVSSDTVVVEITESGQESGTIIDPTSYTVEIPSSGSAPAAGNVRFNEPLSIQGGTMTIFRQTEFSQESELGNGSQFYPKVVESALDKLTMIAQELKGGVVTTRHGESYAYAESAGVATHATYADEAVVASGLVEGANISATYAETAEIANNLAAATVVTSAANATSATNAVNANIAGGLTPLAKMDIITSAGGGGMVLLGAKAYGLMPDMGACSRIFSATGTTESSYTTGTGDSALGNGYGGLLVCSGSFGDSYSGEAGFWVELPGSDGTANVNVAVIDPKNLYVTSGGALYETAGRLILEDANVTVDDATYSVEGGTVHCTVCGPATGSVVIPIGANVGFSIKTVGTGSFFAWFYPNTVVQISNAGELGLVFRVTGGAGVLDNLVFHPTDSPSFII